MIPTDSRKIWCSASHQTWHGICRQRLPSLHNGSPVGRSSAIRPPSHEAHPPIFLPGFGQPKIQKCHAVVEKVGSMTNHLLRNSRTLIANVVNNSARGIPACSDVHIFCFLPFRPQCPPLYLAKRLDLAIWHDTSRQKLDNLRDSQSWYSIPQSIVCDQKISVLAESG